MSLAGKKIVLGVSGGIAAYKTPETGASFARSRGRRPRSHDRSGKSLYHPT